MTLSTRRDDGAIVRLRLAQGLQARGQRRTKPAASEAPLGLLLSAVPSRYIWSLPVPRRLTSAQDESVNVLRDLTLGAPARCARPGAAGGGR